MDLDVIEACPGSELYSVCCSSDLYNSDGENGSESRLILLVLASLLERIVARNERLLFSSGIKKFSREYLCVFSASQIPAMSIQKYLERIFKYAHCSPSVFVVAYAYIDRLMLSRGINIKVWRGINRSPGTNLSFLKRSTTFLLVYF